MDDEKRNPGAAAYDVIVVGAGVIGLSVAWCAARRGLAVCVVERSEPGAGASSVAAGMLAPVGEASFGEQALLDLSLASHAIWPEFSEDLSAATGLETGYLPLGALQGGCPSIHRPGRQPTLLRCSRVPAADPARVRPLRGRGHVR